MLPKYHILFGFLFALFLFLIFNFIGLFGFFIIFASSVLIDIDAYLNYIFTKKDFSLRNAIKYLSEKRRKAINLSKEKKTKIQSMIRVFHGVEVLLILFILGIFVNKIFLFIFIGFSFHLFLDLIEMIYYKFRIAKISTLYDFIKFNQKGI
ncbi:MAG: hypothetical protein AABX80_00920 [Nanoarchaeota archaeon]